MTTENEGVNRNAVHHVILLFFRHKRKVVDHCLRDKKINKGEMKFFTIIPTYNVVLLLKCLYKGLHIKVIYSSVADM